MPIFFSDLAVGDLEGNLIFLDIDGTVVADGETTVPRAAGEKIAELQKHNAVYLCSNKKNHGRNRSIAAQARAPYLETSARKPSKKILECVPRLGDQPRVVIGDKFLTDAWFARRIGARFIKVRRQRGATDNFLVRITYRLDDWLGNLFA